MKTILICGAMIATLGFTVADTLTGRWESKPSPKGTVTGIVFKPDNSFEGYVNRKPFVSGTYTLQDSIFSFVDNGCEGKKGVYKIVLFSNSDSLRFDFIEDSCVQRKEGMSKIVLGRVNKKAQ